MLEARVQACLALLAELASSERNALKTGDRVLIMEIDEKIESAVGEKERQMGALREHIAEHRCL